MTQLLADALGIEASSLIGEITNNNLTNYTPEDITGPELLNFSLSKNAVDVSGGAQEITLEVELRDLGLGIGIKSGQLLYGSKLCGRWL